MDQPQLVLDYTSPRPRVKLRLATNSVLRQGSIDGRCVVTEILSGKARAVRAMLFAMLACLFMPVPMVAGGPPAGQGDIRFALVLVAIFELITLAVSFVVVRNTWRRTLLSADQRMVTVEFSGPLSRTRQYSSPGTSIEKIEVAPTDPLGSLGELRIAPLSGAELHLFTDHPFEGIKALADNLAAAMGGSVTVTLGVADVPRTPQGVLSYEAGR